MASNCSFEAVDDVMKNLVLVIYVPIFIIGLILNYAALVVFCVSLPKWTESTIYMTSLALMDLLVLFPLPFKMHAANHQWPGGLQPLCLFLEILYFMGVYGSIYTIMCISVDRWLAICHPFRAKQWRSPMASLATCMLVWVLGFTTVSFIMNGFRQEGPKDFHCFQGFSKNSWRPSLIIPLLVFGFLVPALVLVNCSVQTVWTLKKSEQQSSQSCVKFIYSSLGAFLAPFTPSNLGILLQFLVHQGVIKDCRAKNGISIFLQVTMCLSNVTCCLDALCYYFITNEARSSSNIFKNQRSVTSRTSKV